MHSQRCLLAEEAGAEQGIASGAAALAAALHVKPITDFVNENIDIKVKLEEGWLALIVKCQVSHTRPLYIYIECMGVISALSHLQ